MNFDEWWESVGREHCGCNTYDFTTAELAEKEREIVRLDKENWKLIALLEKSERMNTEMRCRLTAELAEAQRKAETIRGQAIRAGCVEVEVCLGCGKEGCDSCPAGTGMVLRRQERRAEREGEGMMMRRDKCGNCFWFRRDEGTFTATGWMGRDAGNCNYDPKPVRKHESDYCRNWLTKRARDE